MLLAPEHHRCSVQTKKNKWNYIIYNLGIFPKKRISIKYKQ